MARHKPCAFCAHDQHLFEKLRSELREALIVAVDILIATESLDGAGDIADVAGVLLRLMRSAQLLADEGHDGFAELRKEAADA